MTIASKAIYTETKIKDRIIVALDVSEATAARSIVAELNGQVGAFKIGLQLFTSAGHDIVREFTSAGHKIFLDLKFHDIPNTVAMASVEAARLGVWMFNIHAIGGSEMIKRTVVDVRTVCDRENLTTPKIIGVTVLTSSDDNALKEVGIEKPVTQQVVSLAHLAAENGLDGVVASPNEVIAIRGSVSDKNFLLVTPGIRPISATNHDQKRVTTFDQAIKNGSDFVVIGRPITEAADRSDAVAKILAELAD